MTSNHPDRAARSQVVDAARAATRSTIGRFALDQGAQVISRPAFPGSDITVKDVEPIAGLCAAYDVEMGAHHIAATTSATPAKPGTRGTTSAWP